MRRYMHRGRRRGRRVARRAGRLDGQARAPRFVAIGCVFKKFGVKAVQT